MKAKLGLIGLIAPAALSAFSTSVNALEVYDDGTNSFEFLGWYRPTYVTGGGVDQLIDNSSQFGFAINRNMSDDWTVRGHVELGYAFVDSTSGLIIKNSANRNEVQSANSDDNIWSRLGYIEFQHEKWGRITVGKAWAVWSDMTLATDGFEMSGGDASGTYNLGSDGGISGVGRAEQVIQYRNSIGNFSYALQFQATDEDITIEDEDGEVTLAARYDNGYGVTLGYQLPFNTVIRAAYNIASIEVEEDFSTPETEVTDDEIYGFGVVYGQFQQKGLYAALTYAESENHEIDDAGQPFDAKGVEVLIEYRWGDHYSVYGGYNNLQENDDRYGDEEDEQFEIDYSVLGAKYYWSQNMVLFAEYKMENSTTFEGIDVDDLFGIGFRYDFY